MGAVSVQHPRLGKFQSIVNPKRVEPANMEIVDIVGLVKSAFIREGLENEFLADTRKTDAILNVLRCFDDRNIFDIVEGVIPILDKEIVYIDLQLEDHVTIEKKTGF